MKQLRTKGAAAAKLLAVIAIVLWLALGLAWWQRQAIFDWWRLRGYVPSAEIVALADDTTMKPEARRLFYVYRPELSDRTMFNEQCRGSTSEFTIVLGCYISAQGIYIFDVDDPRLDGIHEVTAAHELLHAVYNRLSADERARIDALTAEAFENLDNDRIRANIEQYRAADASVVPNELHSILGTEVEELSPELEAYYAQHFADRAQIVKYSEAYESALTDRTARAAEYAAQLKALEAQIKQNNQTLDSQTQSLNVRRQQLEADRVGADPDTFNQQVDSFNSDLAAYNALVNKTRTLIDEYNQLVAAYNEVIVEQQSLFEAIDSRPEAIAQ